MLLTFNMGLWSHLINEHTVSRTFHDCVAAAQHGEILILNTCKEHNWREIYVAILRCFDKAT